MLHPEVSRKIFLLKPEQADLDFHPRILLSPVPAVHKPFWSGIELTSLRCYSPNNVASLHSVRNQILFQNVHAAAVISYPSSNSLCPRTNRTMGFCPAHVHSSPNNNSHFHFFFTVQMIPCLRHFHSQQKCKTQRLLLIFFTSVSFFFLTSTIKCTYINFFCYLQNLNLFTSFFTSYINSWESKAILITSLFYISQPSTFILYIFLSFLIFFLIKRKAPQAVPI